MKPREIPPGLRVAYSDLWDDDCHDRVVQLGDHGGFAYRVIHNASDMALPIPFVRDADAVAAAAAIADVTDWTVADVDEIRHAIKEAGGFRSLCRKMLEALAW